MQTLTRISTTVEGIRTTGENPTIGILLCKRKKDALIRLTLPKDANIFAPPDTSSISPPKKTS